MDSPAVISDGLSAHPHRRRLTVATDALMVGGGAERVLFTLLNNIDRQRFDLRVMSVFAGTGGSSFLESLECNGISVKRYSLTPRWHKRLPSDLYRFLRDLRKEDCDVVHSSGDRGLSVLAGLVFRVQVRLYVVHDTHVSRTGLGFWWQRAVMRWFATDVVAVSSAVASGLRRNYSIPDSRITVIRNACEDLTSAVSFPEFVRGSDLIADRDGSHRIVTVARLVHEKGVDVLLRSFAFVLTECPSARLTVVGGGPLLRRLRDDAAALGIGQSVVFAGNVEDVTPFLLDADVFALTSRSEGLGLAAIEAMAVGRPVVASAVGGLPEVVVHGVTGFLVAPAQPGEGSGACEPRRVAEAILCLLRDPHLAARMGLAGRRRYEREFGVKPFVDRYARLYSRERI